MKKVEIFDSSFSYLSLFGAIVEQTKIMFPNRKRLRSRSVTPVGDDRDSRGSPEPNRLPSACLALLLDLVWKAPDREIDGPSPPRSRAVAVDQTSGGSLPLTDSTVPIEKRQSKPSLGLPIGADEAELLEDLDLDDDEIMELQSKHPGFIQQRLRRLRGDDAPGLLKVPTKASASNTVALASLVSSAMSEASVSSEIDVRPLTSREKLPSQTVARDYGSDPDSDIEDVYDVSAILVVRNGIPDSEDLEEPVDALINEVDTGMDNAIDTLLSDSSSFKWEEDFGLFRAVREDFSGPTPGSVKDYDSPYDAFTDIWDEEIIRLIVTETNRYAHQVIDAEREAGTLKASSRLHSWTDTNADEIMTLFGMLMYMAIDLRSSITEYWSSDDVLHLPGFKRLITYNRYILLNKFLHFVDNSADASQPMSRNEAAYLAKQSAKLRKVAPIIEHLNNKFNSLYNLGAEFSIDESLTLFKGRLSWIQTIRSKAARFGIKSYELCESRTGYMSRFQIYTGKDDSTDGNPLLGVDLGGKSIKVVLELLQGLEHRGHCVVMDNFYNCPALARYLKSLGFDCFGPLRVNRRNVSSAIAKVPRKVSKGTIIARHCGDVSIIAWMDSKMVNIISTYHTPETYMGTRAGKPLLKPVCVKDYNTAMGGINLKDQKLSMYPLERKRCLKWYMEIFKRLMNVSVHNAFVLYRSSMARRDKLAESHREFRFELARSLIKRHRPCLTEISQVPGDLMRLRRDIVHEPMYTSGRSNRKRCTICYRQRKTKFIHSRCVQCDIYLCFEDCWRIWHSAAELPGEDVIERPRPKR
ncbi:piggyBac transposable element-derived protein 4-like isoform X2 [Spodoptera litura]|uniref:PiggyBac transposable element-derived protein 4-like isoform X2 n=1 Tax=Spodoptera litura TaxID=69820 RepID=A0A9J7IZS8_SPOLT|nr:piggyBac transposable element-derived protein 4-like isoform X2 [Spodoptera litura]